MSDANFSEWTPCEMYGHAYEDGVCQDCGEKQEPETDDGITYWREREDPF